MYVAATPLCPLFEAPEEGAQRVDEILLGWPVSGPEEVRGDWWRIRTHYGYTGWVRREGLAPAAERPLGEQMVVTASMGSAILSAQLDFR